MPKFETPEPISVLIELGAGAVRMTATDRADTVVEVRPSDESDESDVKAAKQVRVDYANGSLQVVGPKVRAFDFSRKSRSVDVTVELPAGSRVTGEVQAGDFRGTGTLGDSRFKTAAGNVRLEGAGSLRADVSAGHITAEEVNGSAELSTGTGKLRLGVVGGTAVVKNSNGDATIDMVTGDVRARSANGDISVGKALSDVDAKTSNGAIRIGEVTRGSVVLQTAAGDLEVGIAEGTAAWLEVDTGFGHVRNELENTSGPKDSEETVEVRAHTSFGDVTIRRR